MLRVTAIIPTTFSREARKTFLVCVHSLKKSAKSVADLRIVAVTDRSESVPALSNEFPDITVVSVQNGTGFSEMNNMAIEVSVSKSVDFFILINDDACVHSSFFSQLTQLVKNNKDVEVFAPFIFNTTKRSVDSYGVEYFVSGYAKNITRSTVTSNLASASCIVIKKSLLCRLKNVYGFYFCTILHYYLEDVELMIRARMLGALICRSRQLLAYHKGSATSKEKSWFPMYHTYRNIGWVIMLTWPKQMILRNILSILLVQVWIAAYSTRKYGPKMYFTLLLDGLHNMRELLSIRNRIIKGYLPDLEFSRLFSNLSFRTYHGVKIPALRLW